MIGLSDNHLRTQGIYIITTNDDWPCKIGITDNLVERIQKMQTGNWHQLRAHRFWFPYTDIDLGKDKFKTPSLNTARMATVALEKQVHQTMAELDVHMRGEWFDIDADDADAVLAKIAKENNYRLVSPTQVLKAKYGHLTKRSDAQSFAELLEVATEAVRALTGNLNVVSS